MIVRALALAAVAALAGCFSPDIPNGGLVCAAGAKPCPDGFYCAVNHTCWRNGSAPPGGDHHVALGTGTSGGVASGPSHRATLSVGQPVVGVAASSSHQADFGLLRATQSQ